MSKKYKYWEIIKSWQALNINDIAKLAIILNNFQILFTYNSCTIEGNNIDYYNVREIFENGKVIKCRFIRPKEEGIESVIKLKDENTKKTKKK